MKMLVIVPSRGRPQNIEQLIGAFKVTRSDEGAELLVVADNDDPTQTQYTALNHNKREQWFATSVDERRGLAGSLNEMSTYYAREVPRFDIIGFMGDDHRPRTTHWDAFIAEAMQSMGGTGIVYGNDLIQGALLPTAVFISSDIIRTLGYMCPPGMKHMYLDNVWKLWGERLGKLTYLSDVIIEHMHPVAGKATWDEHYARVNDGEMYNHDKRVMDEYVATQLDNDIEKLRKLL